MTAVTGFNDRNWYTPTTGIWQSVWLTFTSRSYLTAVKITPNLDALTAEVEVEAKNARSMEVRLEAHYEVDGEKKEARAAAQISVNEKGRGILVFPDYDHRFLLEPGAPEPDRGNSGTVGWR